MFVDIAGVYSHYNFDELRPNSNCFEVLRMVFYSIRNLRKVPNFDITNRALSLNCDIMKRTSYLAELELHYIYALRLKNSRVGRGTPYFTAINEYIDTFYYKYDVMQDLR